MFRSFQGVPFAAPPVDSLRFGAPQPVTPWTEERKASGWEDIKCIQYGFLYDEAPKVWRKRTILFWLRLGAQEVTLGDLQAVFSALS